MKIETIKAHVIKLDPSSEQKEFFNQCLGNSRFAYNLALQFMIRYYEKHGKSISEAEVRKRLNKVKAIKFPFLCESPKSVVQQSIKDLGNAWKKFFRKDRTGNGVAGRPVFKKKSDFNDSCRLDNGNGTIIFDGKRIKLPKVGWVKSFEEVRWLNGHLIQAVLKRNAYGYFLSCTFRLPYEALPEPLREAIGIDLGVAIPLACAYSDTKFKEVGKEERKKLVDLEKKRNRYFRIMSRRKTGSKNRAKAKLQVQRTFMNENRVRTNFQHQVSTSLTSNFKLVVFEDLKLSNMTRQVKKSEDGSPRKNVSAKSGLNRELLRLGLAGLVSMTERKALDTGSKVIKVDPRFTSQTCSDCGSVDKESRKSQSRFQCVHCGFKLNADFNAALNIRALGIKQSSLQ